MKKNDKLQPFFFATLFLTLKRFTYFHRLCCTFISQSISFSVQIHKSTYVRVIFWFGLKFTTGPSRRIRGRHLPPSPRRFSADRSEAAIVIFPFLAEFLLLFISCEAASSASKRPQTWKWRKRPLPFCRGGYYHFGRPLRLLFHFEKLFEEGCILSSTIGRNATVLPTCPKTHMVNYGNFVYSINPCRRANNNFTYCHL